MNFRFIEKGTRLDIRQKDAPEAPTYYGTFEKMEQGVTFLISCDVLYEHIDTPDPAIIYTFTFFRKSEAFTFDARLGEKTMHLQTPVISVTATTLIKSYSRRSSHRIRVQMSLNLYEFDEQQPDEPGTPFCTGIMHDVSRGGLTFLSNEKIPLVLRKVYLSEFIVNGITFRLPVEYVRGSERSLSPLYRYDYAFMYNGENLTDDLNRMTLALFEQQLKGR